MRLHLGTRQLRRSGLNATPLHGHAALFGVYGMLGIGLMLVCLRALLPDAEWNEGMLKFSFWAMNGGLLAMCLLSLLPVGLMQTWASVNQGYWYARGSEFLGTPANADPSLAASSRRHPIGGWGRGAGPLRRHPAEQANAGSPLAASLQLHLDGWILLGLRGRAFAHPCTSLIKPWELHETKMGLMLTACVALAVATQSPPKRASCDETTVLGGQNHPPTAAWSSTVPKLSIRSVLPAL
ncbi:MAG: cbb3-type cytochrome c oxidase subunit I [Gemmataceae bacterium]|nr:cbb3-type cytochrome c oxidase subunit I [Gemmataceae bacterium]